MKVFCVIFVVLFLSLAQCRDIEFTNRCGHAIWISPLTNNQGPGLPEGIVKISTGSSSTYQIPSGGWGGRFWPKTGCDSNGQNCEVGQSVPPCLPTGCDPPSETKVEFFFPAENAPGDVWYDISLVDGYSLAAEIVPSVQQGSCVTTKCAVSLDACPSNENDVGDLRMFKNGLTVSCLAPCKKWNYPAPYGLGRSENDQPGVMFCCPTPPISVEQCRTGPIENTKYVELVRRTCPTAYSYAYDDEAGLHNCPNNVSFKVTFCS